ncbi:MAG: DUF2752 domain-containing protein [Chthoniobacteraceae bacterium]
MEWRPLCKGEIDHEFLWLAVSGASLGVAAAWMKSPLPLPACVFHQLTGMPCPTCGATRCVRDFIGGHFGAAFAWNPLVFCALTGIVLFDFYALAVLLFRLPRARISITSRTVGNWLRFAVIVLVATNWMYLIEAGR